MEQRMRSRLTAKAFVMFSELYESSGSSPNPEFDINKNVRPIVSYNKKWESEVTTINHA